MSVPTLCGYILIQKESQSVQGVNSYDILFAGMSNVWKRYLFANPVTYTALKIHPITKREDEEHLISISVTLPKYQNHVELD